MAAVVWLATEPLSEAMLEATGLTLEMSEVGTEFEGGSDEAALDTDEPLRVDCAVLPSLSEL